VELLASLYASVVVCRNKDSHATDTVLHKKRMSLYLIESSRN